MTDSVTPPMRDQPWNPSQPLRADATNRQIWERRKAIPAESLDQATWLVAREFAAACATPPSPETASGGVTNAMVEAAQKAWDTFYAESEPSGFARMKVALRAALSSVPASEPDAVRMAYDAGRAFERELARRSGSGGAPSRERVEALREPDPAITDSPTDTASIIGWNGAINKVLAMYPTPSTPERP